MKNFQKLMLGLAFLGLAVTSCSKDGSLNEETASFRVNLVDAPGDYEKVMIDVQGIEVIVDGEKYDLGPVEAGIYDLLELTGGVSAMLVDTEVPAGKLSQIRLVLGDNNTIIVKGEEFHLKTPSAQQSGLKLNVHEELEPGILYDFILDFNVDKSVVVMGAGQGYLLKPVIRATTAAESGAVAGVVSPAEVQSMVTATDGTTEVTAFTNTETGEFLLYGVPAGTYTVTVVPDSTSGFSTYVKEDVVVEQAVIYDMGKITLE